LWLCSLRSKVCCRQRVFRCRQWVEVCKLVCGTQWHQQRRFTYRATLRGGVRVARAAAIGAPNHSELMLGSPFGEFLAGAPDGLHASHIAASTTVEHRPSALPLRGDQPFGRSVWVERRHRIQDTQQTSWRSNDKKASGTERCTAPREGKALKGAIPRALPARNKAGTARGGV
jgi:hypothetical protein